MGVMTALVDVGIAAWLVHKPRRTQREFKCILFLIYNLCDLSALSGEMFWIII
jgi:hypothetical protein